MCQTSRLDPRDSEAPSGEEERRGDGRAQTVEEGEGNKCPAVLNKRVSDRESCKTCMSLSLSLCFIGIACVAISDTKIAQMHQQNQDMTIDCNSCRNPLNIPVIWSTCLQFLN